ncbi:Putative cyclin-D6-1 [Morus notabilis]|uniref:Putative cyclin-D6-1 n=1 Tax=Morus notabilis TaxID=981085 RepID=W9S3A7_9ROSA|nr:Putative cyclin-D6-1 [Morus notabilis]
MNPDLDYDPYNPLPDISPVPEFGKQGLERYLNVEATYTATPVYCGSVFGVWRERAVIVIFNVSRREHFDPFIPYLAMNYFDRFISREQNIPARNRELRAVMPWEFLTMELSIVKGLDWHLRSVTALSFVRFFTPVFDSTYGFRHRTINEIIIQSQNDFKMSRFRPSVIAASALLAASSFLYPEQFVSFVEKIASQIIFKELEVLICMERLIDMCKDLRIQIESAVPKNEYLPKRKVRAGDTSEQVAETSKSAAAGTPDRATSKNSKWKSAIMSWQVFAASSERDADQKSKQEAAENPEQSTAACKSKEETAESSEGPSVASTEQVGAKKSSESTEEPKQVATERSEEVATESSEQSTSVPTEQVVAQKAEESTKGAKEGATEQPSVVPTEQLAAQKKEESIQEPKQVASERLEEKATELIGQPTVIPTEQVAAKKSEESMREPKQTETESLEEEATELAEQQKAVLTEQVAAKKSEAPTKKSVKFEVSPEESKQAATESSQELKYVSTEQLAAQKSKKSTDGSIHAAVESLEQPTAEESKQVAATKSEESTVQESTQATREKSKQVATESSERSTTELAQSSASTSSQRPSKGNEKVVEITEIPKKAEDSEDMEFDFVLRWTLGETNAEDFVIFMAMEDLDGPLQLPGELARVNQARRSDLNEFCNFCCCCNCDCCFNCCSLL